MSWLAPRLRDGRYLKRELLAEAVTEPEDPAEKDNAAPSVFKAVEAVAKGLEIPLPNGFSFRDKYGHERHRVRVRWWDPASATYRSAAMLHPELRQQLPDDPIPPHAVLDTLAKPTFFGHYWLEGQPAPQSGRAACVDYSAGKDGPLVAYRFDGERELSADRFVLAN